MDRLYPLTVTTPANTPVATPVSTPFPLDDAYLEYVHITVPSGCAGLVGIRILWAGTQVIPFNNLYWLTPDDEKIPVEFQEYMTATGLVVLTYNLDVFPHNIYLRALIKLAPAPGEPDVMAATSSVALPSDQGTTGTSGIDTLTAPSDLSSLVTADLQDQPIISSDGTTGSNGTVPGTEPVALPPVPSELVEPPITVTPVNVPPTTPVTVVKPPIVITPIRSPVKRLRPEPPVRKLATGSRHTMTAHKHKTEKR